MTDIIAIAAIAVQLILIFIMFVYKAWAKEDR